MADNAVNAPQANRPIWVWIISIFFMLSAGYTVLSYALIYSGSVPITPAQRAYFSSQTAIDNLATIGIASLNILGAIWLFRLRRAAPYFFLSAFVLSLLLFTYQIAAKNWLGAISGTGLVGVIIGQLLIIGVLVYSFRLRKLGVLK
jgi:hypothetical protein